MLFWNEMEKTHGLYLLLPPVGVFDFQGFLRFKDLPH